jgi:cephalosporin-C deacetylase-like acetyl esterase
MLLRTIFAFVVLAAFAASPAAATPPLDLWGPEPMSKIRDRSTLNPTLVANAGYFEVYYDSEIGDAKWGDDKDSPPPHQVHKGGTIRIHGYLATPPVGGPYPGIVIGHGHVGRGSPELAIALAALGYVALSIDGPGQGKSTGPSDTEQRWISVEEVMNEPSPEVGYLYHYAYAGMRGLTLLDHLSRLLFNPLRIDRDRLGVIGASMGGQFTYMINGVDDRVKGAVAIAVAGDWANITLYEGSWLYHGLYHYTRDGLRSTPPRDALNTISDICTDPTLRTFLDYFDPIQYAPTQHAPLLTIIGSHDQYFTLPAINTTFDKLGSAGTNPRFLKRLMITPNGKHGVINEDDLLPTLLPVLSNIDRWFRYSFRNGPTPPATPTVRVEVEGGRMLFRVTAPPGSGGIASAQLHYATQVDTLPAAPCDFATLELARVGNEYQATLPIGTLPPCGPPASPENLLVYASVQDAAAYTISSKIYYQGREMGFGTDFIPRIEHFPRDDLAVPPPPGPCPAGALDPARSRLGRTP